MLRFQSLFLATLAVGTHASLPKLGGSYEPATSVSDHAGIAGDQDVIEKYVGFGDSNSFEIAQAVYEQGGHSKSYAEITLTEGLPTDVPKKTTISGTTGGDQPLAVVGTALADYKAGDTIIGMQYPTSDSNDEYVLCKVGGLPSPEQFTEGCIKAEDGEIEIGSNVLSYSSVVNKNARTIEGFSTTANKRFRFNENESEDYYPFFQKYIDYYGSYDFADKICTAGFTGGTTPLFTNGEVSLTGYGAVGKSQIAKKCTAFISILLYSQREMYDAIDDCKKGCTTVECNDDAVHALDEAVAFYVGNQHGTSDTGGLGNLGFSLAEKRGKNFATMNGDDFVSGQSNVNEVVMREFNVLKDHFINKECDPAETKIPVVATLMMVPVVQGTLRYAYLTSANDSPSEAQQSEGAIFAAGVLPLVHHCDAAAAQTIYDNMRLTADKSTKADFAMVKEAFESVYDCMGITCADVGGLADEANPGFYIAGAEPCGGAAVLKIADSGSAIMFLSAVSASIAAVAAIFM